MQKTESCQYLNLSRAAITNDERVGKIEQDMNNNALIKPQLKKQLKGIDRNIEHWVFSLSGYENVKVNGVISLGKVVKMA